MKISQAQAEFKPITIVLESREEVELLRGYLRHDCSSITELVLITNIHRELSKALK